MIKNNIGFTFIELIIVVFIISIIGVFGISNFNSILTNQSLETEINGLNENIIELDNSLSKINTDYEFILNKDLYTYAYSLNSNYKKGKQNLSLNGYSGNLLLSSSLTGVISLQIYFNDKLLKTDFYETSDYSLNFHNNGEYILKTNIGNNYFNDIYVNYFSNIDEKSKIKLEKIYDGTNYYTGIVIKNSISGKKTYYDLNNNILKIPIYLDFSSNGLNKTLTLN